MYSNTSHPVYYERSKRWPVKMARMARTVRNELMDFGQWKWSEMGLIGVKWGLMEFNGV